MNRDHGAMVIAVGGTVAAVIGSIDVSFAPWGSRVMLIANLVCVAISLRSRPRSP